MNDSQIFSGGKALGPIHKTLCFTSRTVTVPFDGYMEIRAMGAGGGGARANSGYGTGGYSGAWGCKRVAVTKGQSVVVTIGAGGAGKTTSDGAGSAGGSTTVVHNSVTYTAPGGKGGVYNTSRSSPNTIGAEWDFGADSVWPGIYTSSGKTGGAGVDILAQGNNATTSGSSDGSGGGGTGSASSSSTGGGASPGGKDALGRSAGNPPNYWDASGGEWGISFYGGSGGGASGVPAGNGGGGNGSNSNVGVPGGHGGGGGGTGSNSNAGGAGGIGGGGGASGATGGNGGDGFVCLTFIADTGL